MHIRPDGAALLEIARSVLRLELIPGLAGEQQHAALMIANAIAIGARQLAQGDEIDRAELVALRELLGQPAGALPYTAPALRAELLQLNRLLVRHINSDGTGPGTPGHARVYRHLLATARQLVAESNPKYLGAGA